MLKRLTDMGFPEDECRCALAAAFNDPGRAVQYLTEGEGAAQTMAPAAAAELQQGLSRKRPRSHTPPAVPTESGRLQCVSDTGAGLIRLSNDAPAASTRAETREVKLISGMAEFLRQAARQYTVAELVNDYFQLYPSERKSMGGTKANEFLKRHGSLVFQLKELGHGQMQVSLSSQHATVNREQAQGAAQYLTEGESAEQTMAPATAAEPRQSLERKRPRSPTPVAAVRTTAQLQLERVGDAVCATTEQLVQLVRGLLRPNGGLTLQRTAKDLDRSLEQLSRQRGWGQIQTRSSDGQMVPFHVTRKWLQRNAGPGSFEQAPKKAGGPAGASWKFHSPHGDSRSVINAEQVAAATRSQHVSAVREQIQPNSKRPQRIALRVGDRVQAAPDAKVHHHLCNAEIGLVESVIENRGVDGGDTVVQVRAACGHLEWYLARDVEPAGGAFFPFTECVQWALAQHGKSESTELLRARANEVHARKQVAEEREKFKQAELEVMTLRNKLQLAEDKLSSAVAAVPAPAEADHQARNRSERPGLSGQDTSCESHSRSGVASMEASTDRTAPESSPSAVGPEMAELLRDEEPEQAGSQDPTAAIAGPRAATVFESEYERQLRVLKRFYEQHDPTKDEAACRAILDKRRQTAPHLHEVAWKLLCSRLAAKYGAEPAALSASNYPGNNESTAVAEAALSAQVDALRAKNEALIQENRDQASRFAAAEALWAKERKLREALALKAQIAAAEARRELKRKTREDSSAVAENVRPGGVDSNVNNGDTISARATAAQDCEARLLATAAIARDAASRFRISLLSIVDALVPSTTDRAAANSTSWTDRHGGSVSASSCGVASNVASAAANFIDLLQRYTEESLGLVEELARPDSEASREIAALARAETISANGAMSTASGEQVVPASAVPSS